MFIKIRSFTFIFAVFSLLFTISPVFAESRIQVVPDSFDFGRVKKGDLAIAKFQLKNSGTTAVTIQWMEFSEQGLVAQVSPRINAGQSVEVTVNWNTSNFEGDISGNVVLGLNGPDNPEVTFTLSGTVIPGDEMTN